MNPQFEQYLLLVTTASSYKKLEVIQSLWSGYGEITRYQLSDAGIETVVIKSIKLDRIGDHPRGWNTDISHDRKVKSYQVETAWYEKWNAMCIAGCKTPQFLGSFAEGKNQWIILEDLNTQFPLRKQSLDIDGVKTCLKWLANFHATFMQQVPTDLWEKGTYWHLETRPDEWEKMNQPELKAKAAAIDTMLNACVHQTIVHGDAKLANFCFSKDGKSVAAVDFQYVGGGCGMKDVAYFLGSCLSGEECELYENDLLRHYFTELAQAIDIHQVPIVFKTLENEWRKLYPIAVTDFVRFLLGWMPSHQKINAYNLKIVASVLKQL